MIKEIAAFIATQATLTIGTDLFVGHRPQGTTANCDVVLESSGGAVFFNWAKRVDPVIQILSRGKTYFTARARAWAIYDAIYRAHTAADALGNVYPSAGWTIGPVVAGGPTYIVMIIEPLSSPQYIGQDEKSRYEFSTNYVFKIRKV